MTAITSHFTLQHEIFILDSYLKKPLPTHNKRAFVQGFIDELLTALRMEPLAPLQIFDAVDNRAPGYSFIIPITTSHISGHYFEKPGKHPHIRMDVYSCASVNWRKLIMLADRHLKLGAWHATFIDRQIGIDGSERLMMDIKGEGADVLDESKLLIDNMELTASRVTRKKVAMASKR